MASTVQEGLWSRTLDPPLPFPESSGAGVSRPYCLATKFTCSVASSSPRGSCLLYLPAEVRTVQLYGVVGAHLTLLATTGQAFGVMGPRESG